MTSPTENEPPRNGTAPAEKQPRTIRTRNAALLAAASLVLGVGIGAASSTPGGTATATQTPPTPSSAASPFSEPSIVLKPEPTAEPTPEPTLPTLQPATPVVVKGSGTQKTKPFDMPAGDFTVVISGSGDGNVIADLVPRGGEGSTNLFNEISNGKYKYETVAYGVVPGSYYLDVTNSNAWAVTFTPLE